VAFSPDGARLASGSADSTVKLWDARTGAILQTLSGQSGGGLGLAFSSNGARLASGSFDGPVKLWDTKTGDLVQTLPEYGFGGNRSLAFSPNGARLAIESADDSVRFLDSTAQAVVQTLIGHNGKVRCVAFSSDGARLASGGEEKTVKVWDLKTGAALQTLTGHTGTVTQVGFSPDGAHLASRDHKNQKRAWDLRTGKEISDASAPDWLTAGHAGARSPDGHCYAIPHGDGTILVVRPIPPDEFELGYREAMSRPDPDWHRQQAQQYEKEQSWFAAAFHWEQVLKSRPEDSEAKKSLATAREQLQKR
jgi:WD40 repeat protein